MAKNDRNGLILVALAWLCLAVAVWGFFVSTGKFGLLTLPSIIIAQYSYGLSKSKLFLARTCQVLALLFFVYITYLSLAFD